MVGLGENVRMNDESRAPFKCLSDSRFNFLNDVAKMSDKMKKPSKIKREKCFPIDTSEMLRHMCLSFVDLTKYILSIGYDYDLLGRF